MNKQETTQIITLLAGSYESIANKSQIQRQMMLNTWYECLNDLDYNLVLQAVKKTIIENQYPPTIHEIRKNAIEIINPTENDALNKWNECYKMICNGTYMIQEEFDKHSEVCKKFIGSINQLRAYATNPDFNMDVVRSNFLKQYEILIQREKQNKLLPEQMKTITEKLANKMDLKMLN